VALIVEECEPRGGRVVPVQVEKHGAVAVCTGHVQYRVRTLCAGVINSFLAILTHIKYVVMFCRVKKNHDEGWPTNGFVVLNLLFFGCLFVGNHLSAISKIFRINPLPR